MGLDSSPGLGPGEDRDVTYCARHPDVETYLRCSRCGTPICPRCLIQTPVGARCPTCANVRRIPTIDVTPVYLVRGAGAAVLAGALTGIAWATITGGRGFFGFLLIFIAMGIGWVISEAVSAATNRRRSTTLQACAVLGVVVAFLVYNWITVEQPLPRNGDAWTYVAAGIAAFFAASRLKY